MSLLSRAARRLSTFRPRAPSRSVSSKTSDPLTREHLGAPPPAASQFGLARFLQANFFRSNAVFVAATLAVAAVASGAYDSAFQTAWEMNNKGKLYKDIISRYPGLPPNTEPEGGAPEEEAAEEEEAEAAAEATEEAATE